MTNLAGCQIYRLGVSTALHDGLQMVWTSLRFAELHSSTAPPTPTSCIASSRASFVGSLACSGSADTVKFPVLKPTCGKHILYYLIRENADESSAKLDALTLTCLFTNNHVPCPHDCVFSCPFLHPLSLSLSPSINTRDPPNPGTRGTFGPQAIRRNVHQLGRTGCEQHRCPNRKEGIRWKLVATLGDPATCVCLCARVCLLLVTLLSFLPATLTESMFMLHALCSAVDVLGVRPAPVWVSCLLTRSLARLLAESDKLPQASSCSVEPAHHSLV